MGLLRYFLASTVVLFHLGGWGFLSGRLAVVGFYVTSGFLITRVLSCDYHGFTGRVAFLANRLLRIYPLFIFLSLLTYMCLKYFGKAPTAVGISHDMWSPADPTIENLSLLPFFKLSGDGMYLLVGSSSIINQSWSISVEIVFYTVAIIASFFDLMASYFLMFFVSLGYFLVNFILIKDFKAGYQDGLYVDALTTLWMFSAGGLAYLYKDKFKYFRQNYYRNILFFSLFIWGLASNDLYKIVLENTMSGWKIILITCLIMTVVCVSYVLFCLRQEDEPQWARALGNLSYGIYLNHFLIAWGLMYSANFLGFSVFGRINTPGFGMVVLFFSTVFAYFTFVFIERPLDTVRRKIKYAGLLK